MTLSVPLAVLFIDAYEDMESLLWLRLGFRPKEALSGVLRLSPASSLLVCDSSFSLLVAAKFALFTAMVALSMLDTAVAFLADVLAFGEGVLWLELDCSTFGMVVLL